MAATKKLGAESSSSRNSFLEATEELIREEGWAAVTARRVAARAGLKFQLIYYYFKSLDDLFLEVFEHIVERHSERWREAVEAEDLPRAMWIFNNESSDNRVLLEFMAMASHKEMIRQAAAHYAERMHLQQTEALTRYLEGRDVEPRIPPAVTAFLMTSIARTLSLEAGLGISGAHAETWALVEAWLQRHAPRS